MLHILSSDKMCNIQTSHFIQYHILCTSTNVNIGIPKSKTAPETYVAEGLMITY